MNSGELELQAAGLDGRALLGILIVISLWVFLDVLKKFVHLLKSCKYTMRNVRQMHANNDPAVNNSTGSGNYVTGVCSPRLLPFTSTPRPIRAGKVIAFFHFCYSNFIVTNQFVYNSTIYLIFNSLI